VFEKDGFVLTFDEAVESAAVEAGLMKGLGIGLGLSALLVMDSQGVGLKAVPRDELVN
jgi:hypothetical protein